MQTTGKDPSTYARFGNFGGKSFKLSSVLSRLNEENEFKSELPIEMKIFSPNITRSLKIIKFPDLFFPSLHIPYLSEPHNIVIDANRMNFANLLEYINTLQQPHRTEINLDEEEAKHTITEESASFYKTNVKPYAENQNKTWMYNIIKNDPSSPEKVLYDCPDFILVHDIQWPDSKDLSKLHCLAIFKDKSLMSIRDLTQAHLPLIKQTIKNAKEIIATYILSPLDIETYFHYHPSVWQLHMHFVIRGLPDKAHKYNTDDIIKNLSIPDYYQNATLNI
ncbi:MAG: scavenger mRNA-decapping enzyme DcpS [Hyperionvirus sp.]|uniref:Scavenger mRNA-decapping enzyme DcpS n=1 Tax=Hyperionvirus sp. TaxID=2487770 RepID=A0A3G5ABS8_9VIRU|nr:MAG: scavenger mRNA-decapping enzyme DcpS [Hyperionvirus sp.]